jgi:hypothetical protein
VRQDAPTGWGVVYVRTLVAAQVRGVPVVDKTRLQSQIRAEQSDLVALVRSLAA